VDARFKSAIFATSAQVYALPRTVSVGDKIDAREIAAQLRRSGYSEAGNGGESKLGTFKLTGNTVEVRPGPESYHLPEGAVLRFASGKLESISGLGRSAGKDLGAYELEPQLVTGLADTQGRGKRRLVTFDDIPKVLVDAVIAIEDRRFFTHGGINYLRFMQAAWTDLREGRPSQGASTLTMQIARGFFLTPEKTPKRKLTEMLIAMELEQRFSKKEIFANYANYVPMGQRGSFAINGLAEASRAYFGKDLNDINLPEAALLAGMIQRPSYLSPYRHPDRALERRNLVLDAMTETGAITRAQAESAKATPLHLAPMNVEASDAPYFVDLVKESLQERFAERDMNQQQFRIYTTLDPDLQKAAAEAIEIGMKSVDAQVTKLRTRRVKVGTGKAAKTETQVRPGPQAQVAMVVLDPHTGDVLALVGGRNYGMSQLNHAVARRPTGSIFKPFVYAAAVKSALDGAQPALTTVSMIDDSPTTFSYGDEIYEPRNYKEEYHGQVTARYALAESLNNATVKLAEMVGYDKVAELARSAGIISVKATPAMALGAYDATPMDMAGAYTAFANAGVRVAPMMVHSVRDAKGDVLQDFEPQRKPVLDARVSYVMTNMMEGVLNFGTAAAVRSKFTAPAAGKTGTSHDGWFAGYTSNLLCIVWIGFDDYSDLRLSGAVTAAPIWAEFMKRAQAMPEYHDMKPFSAPEGVVVVTLDKLTNKLATPACSAQTYTAAFIAGTEPKETCEQSAAASGFLNKLGHLFGIGDQQPTVATTAPAQGGPRVAPVRPAGSGGAEPVAQKTDEQQKKKKGFFGRLFGGGDEKDDKKETPKPPQ
jgi:penicillin-binding protein 1B